MYLIYPKTKEAMIMLGIVVLCNLLLCERPLESGEIYRCSVIVANIIIAAVMLVYVIVAYILYLMAYCKHNRSIQIGNETSNIGTTNKKSKSVK